MIRRISKPTVRRLSVFATAAGVSLLSGVLPGTASDAFAQAPAKALVYCSEGNPGGFDPARLTTSTDFDASAHVLFDTLVEFKHGSSDLVPGLARSWEISADGKTYTFHLRPGVKFQTTAWFKPTRDFNADDAAFTLDRMINPDNAFQKAAPVLFSYAADVGFDKEIARVDTPDPLTLRITLNQPDVAFLSKIAMEFASIQSAEYAQALLKAGKTGQLNDEPVGTGPFILRRFTQDAQIRYDANPDFWNKGRIHIPKLIFSITPDPATRIAKLASGECQMSAFPRPIDLDAVRQNPQLKLMSAPGFNIAYVAYNVTHKPLDSLLVRRALDMAVDKQAILKAVYSGQATIAAAPMPPTQWGYDKDLKDAPLDLAKARDLLRQAGFPNGFSITLWAMPIQRGYNPNARLMAQLIQADWAKIGVQAKIVSYEWGEYNKRAKVDGEHDAILYGWMADYADPDNWLDTVLGCASRKGSNVAKWCNPEFDKLTAAARQTTDRQRRIALYQQAQQIFKREVPYTPIAYMNTYQPMAKNVDGYAISPVAGHRFEDVTVK
ncbi:ABC transporter substrate-binding protein [Robbsia sp. Bb-Pol-6]|uniref:ABC transporter substrate-binding protein n=1 Tax=Robbsia betulipollinis TaxID=2981849 RepID=A0ABT3ZKX5_9BURK|nr:ABC transporter substrate-binding protein [Robbsia betulipollinis]MCY0387002.1 ABC transporter substrate-binding protein [Robbsia betulipollinis]